MKESGFQAKLIKEIEALLPGCLVLKLDANYIQGISDLIILYGPRWAILECKKSESSPYQPNQEYYLDMLNEMSYSATIYPENKEAILDELQSTLRSRRTTRIPRR